MSEEKKKLLCVFVAKRSFIKKKTADKKTFSFKTSFT